MAKKYDALVSEAVKRDPLGFVDMLNKEAENAGDKEPLLREAACMIANLLLTEDIWHHRSSEGKLLEKYPELAMYNEEDHRLDLTRDDPELYADYEVVFDVEDERFYCFLHGTESLLEALGLFFRDNPHITYDMIVEHLEV